MTRTSRPIALTTSIRRFPAWRKRTSRRSWINLTGVTLTSAKQRNLISTVAVLALLAMLSGCDGSASNRPTAPSITTAVHVSIRPSLIDSSTGVLQIENRTGQSLTVALSMHNNDSNQKTSHSVTLGPYETEEVGILESGWAFEPNETVTIFCSGYNSITYKTFRTDNETVGIRESWW